MKDHLMENLAEGMAKLVVLILEGRLSVDIGFRHGSLGKGVLRPLTDVVIAPEFGELSPCVQVLHNEIKMEKFNRGFICLTELRNKYKVFFPWVEHKISCVRKNWLLGR